MRGARALPLLLPGAAGAALGWAPLRDVDWGWHLATTARWLAEGRLPWDDRFSYASQGLYEPVHLGFQLVIYALVQAVGLNGLVLYKMLMGAAIGSALAAGLRRAGAGPWSAAALALTCLSGGAFRLLERPHLFTTLGLVLLLDTLLAARDRGRRDPWWLPPLFAVWANCHPGVVFGVLLLAGFVTCEGLRLASGWRPRLDAARWRRLTLWAALGVGATCLNPLGPGLYPYLLAHRAMQSELQVGELRGLFQHPERGLADHTLMAGLFLAGVGLALRRTRRLDPTLAGASLAFGALGVVVAREGPLALIVLAFALAPVLRPPRRAAPLLLALALLGPAATVSHHLLRRGGWGLTPGAYPVSVCDWILSHRPRGRLYNENSVGGYLVYRLAQDPDGWQVYSDGRMPMFGEALLLSREFAAVEARWQPEILVVPWPPRPELVFACERSPGFAERYRLVYVGPGGKLYLRRGGQNEDLVARFGYLELRYLGVFWPGRVWPDGRPGPLPPPGDPARFAAEVERARREAPELTELPGRDG